MVIEIDRQMTKAEAKEVTNILLNFRQLHKKPRKKLTDMFGFCLKGAIFCVIALAFFLFCVFKGDRDALTMTGLLISIIGVFFLAVYYSVVMKTYQSLLKDNEKHVILTLDEKGIDYEVPGSKRFQTSWDNVAFIRLFQETVAFLPTEITGLLISLSKEHLDEIKGYVRENNVQIEIIE